jgi:ABC-type multidrug transport system fused ATPase/permease subunit
VELMAAASSTKPIRFVRYYRDQFGKLTRLGLVAAVSAGMQALTLVFVVPLANAIARGDDAYNDKVGPLQVNLSVHELAALAALSIICAFVLEIWIAWARSQLMSRWEFAKREQVIGAFLHADYATQAAERLGTLGTLAGYVNRGSSALGSIVNAIEATVTVSIFLLSAIVLEFRAAFVLIATAFLLSFALRPIMRATKRYSKESATRLIDYGRNVTEATRMARDMRVFQATDAVSTRLTTASQILSRLRQRASFVSGITSPVYQYLGMLLVVGALAAAQGLDSLNLAVFGTIALLLLRSLSYGQQFANSYQTILDCIPYVEKLENMLGEYSANPIDDGSIVLEAVHRLDLDDVHYTYDGTEKALDGISATFPVGEIVGVVGPSGSGKSTLSQLILRLREPTSGSVSVNGVEAGEYTLGSWYRHISLVPQDPRLLHASVADNITFLDDSISREQVVDAAKAAGVHDVIEALDGGYDTMVGNAFRDLSGGQIQRVGIARALARGAQVLVLDEPTSALDVHSEEVIRVTLERLRGKVLVMIIAHRLSTLSICDRILVLQDGKVESAGTLADVSERSDFFRRALDAGTLDVGGAERTPTALPDDV